MTEHDHKTVRCENCGEMYCPECDFIAEHREVALLRPGLCGACWESGPHYFEQMRKRYGGVADGPTRG